MKASANLIKKTGITCTEFVVSALTLVALNAILIVPVVKLITEVVSN
jgi:hypothetical protein